MRRSTEVEDVRKQREEEVLVAVVAVVVMVDTSARGGRRDSLAFKIIQKSFIVARR
jgi:hypothetical protein